jgi:hypothetical protein
VFKYLSNNSDSDRVGLDIPTAPVAAASQGKA